MERKGFYKSNKYLQRSAEYYQANNGLASDKAYCLANGADGTVYIGTENGLNYTKADNTLGTFKCGAVKTLYSAKNGNVYFASENTVSNPKILFLDEPTLGLDVFARRELWSIIRKIKGKTTIILTSHYLEEIENLCDNVAILSKGKVLKVGTISEIITETNSNTFEDSFIKLVEDTNE